MALVVGPFTVVVNVEVVVVVVAVVVDGTALQDETSPPACPYPSAHVHWTLDPDNLHREGSLAMDRYSSMISCEVPPGPCCSWLVAHAPGSISIRLGLYPRYSSARVGGAPHNPAEIDRRLLSSKSRSSKLSKSANAPAPISVILLSMHNNSSN